jgi:hypothetical protein
MGMEGSWRAGDGLQAMAISVLGIAVLVFVLPFVLRDFAQKVGVGWACGAGKFAAQN